jgi:hypothetical protein
MVNCSGVVANGITTEREDAKDDFLYSRLSLGVGFEYQPYMLLHKLATRVLALPGLKHVFQIARRIIYRFPNFVLQIKAVRPQRLIPWSPHAVVRVLGPSIVTLHYLQGVELWIVMVDKRMRQLHFAPGFAGFHYGIVVSWIHLLNRKVGNTIVRKHPRELSGLVEGRVHYHCGCQITLLVTLARVALAEERVPKTRSVIAVVTCKQQVLDVPTLVIHELATFRTWSVSDRCFGSASDLVEKA